ncbi:S8 family serine peptidase [Sulfuriroseicoccus oceanibius]|uniref:S8 family serine peptidase n=1 Tax=Sulfuriroseicoccus oceanibius TaxID=2707525 RepID=A0A6B3L9N9_9BACT|nr:S8 family serine peptidase [Sulfuriroseicoccus oceanibius]QQL45691.1 S8 family serine peptidase [Sulfuriroseicoccus oceanibius]
MRSWRLFDKGVVALSFAAGIGAAVASGAGDDAAKQAREELKAKVMEESPFFDASVTPAYSADEFRKQLSQLPEVFGEGFEMNLSNLAAQMLQGQQIAQRSDQNQFKTYELARAQGLRTEGVTKDGHRFELRGFDSNGKPYYIHAFNYTSRTTQGVHMIGEGTERNLTGAGLLAGVWDAGGVLATHVELDGRVTQVDLPDDLDNHATHVAGTIGASGVQELALGMAPNVTIMAHDWDNDLGEMLALAGTTRFSGVTDLLVSNHSYGLIGGFININTPEDPLYLWLGDDPPARFDPKHGGYIESAPLVDALVYNSKYYLPVIAAGNDGDQPGPEPGDDWAIIDPEDIFGIAIVEDYNPALDPESVQARDGYDSIGGALGLGKNVLTVGAATDGVAGYEEEFEDDGDTEFLGSTGSPKGERQQAKVRIARFSSRGPTDDGRIKPEVVANGTGVLSPVANFDDAYDRYSGTSMAAPSAAGAIVLLQEQAITSGAGGALRADTMKALLCHTAFDLGNFGPDYIYGFGLIDAAKASDFIALQRSTLVPGDSKPIHEGRVFLTDIGNGYRLTQYKAQVNGGGPLKITLSWLDLPGEELEGGNNRTRTLVNNLDLRVYSPSGEVFRPWVLDLENPEDPAVPGDNQVDNIEQVYIPNPEEGEYTVLVIASEFDAEVTAQEYAVVVDGVSAFRQEPIGDTTPIDPIDYPFEIIPVEPNVPDEIAEAVVKQMNVFRVPIYATAGTPDAKMRLVGDLLAEYIDNDEDGIADNGPVVNEIERNGSMVVMFASAQEYELALEEGTINGAALNTKEVQIIFANEVSKSLPRGHAEEARSKLLKLILRNGFSEFERYAEFFAETEDSVLGGLMLKARGTLDKEDPEYNIRGWYHVVSTDEARLVSEYFYYVMGSRIGLFDGKGVGRNVEVFWDLYNEEKLRGGDPFAFLLVNKPQYKMPRRLPDGDYRPDRTPPGIPFF